MISDAIWSSLSHLVAALRVLSLYVTSIWQFYLVGYMCLTPNKPKWRRSRQEKQVELERGKVKQPILEIRATTRPRQYNIMTYDHSNYTNYKDSQ